MDAAVVDVTIERTESMTITFEDDLVCTFRVGELRAACPCATCRGFRERGEEAWPRRGQASSIEIRDASFSGAWGISITWSDGHDTGIYAWAYLRRWWQTGLFDPLPDLDPDQRPH
jgi:DUF971 family protein